MSAPQIQNSAGSLWASPIGLALRVWAGYQRFAFQRQTRQHLDRLDDRLLQDVGLSRSEMEQEFRPRLWRF